MSYASIADLRGRYLERDLIALTDENNQTADESRLQSALDDASAEINGYLAARYQLPLVDAVLLTPLVAPQILVRACTDIGVYRLESLRPLSDMQDARKRYEDWIKLLLSIGKGEVQLAGAKLKGGVAETPLQVLGSGEAEHCAAPRKFTSESLGGYGGD